MEKMFTEEMIAEVKDRLTYFMEKVKPDNREDTLKLYQTVSTIEQLMEFGKLLEKDNEYLVAECGSYEQMIQDISLKSPRLKLPYKFLLDTEGMTPEKFDEIEYLLVKLPFGKNGY